MLIVFDFDSTLIDGESIDLLADYYGVSKNVRDIVLRNINGDISFYSSLVQIARLLKGMSYQQVLECIRNFNLMNGAVQCIRELRSKGHVVLCFSVGFTVVTGYFRNILGLHADFSNRLNFANGVLTGDIGGDMMYSDSKKVMFEKMKNILNCGRDMCVAVGGGLSDVPMFDSASTRIAFCPKSTLKPYATHVVEHKDLTEVHKIVNSVS